MKRHNRRRKPGRTAWRDRSSRGRAFRSGRRQRSQARHYEVAVPAVRRKAEQHPLPARLISVVLLVVAVLLMYWFSSDDTFYIHSLRVEGSERLSEAELMRISGLNGLHIFWVDTQAVEQAFSMLPDIASAQLRCGLPADCVVSLTERMPLFIWRQGDAQIWVGTDGMLLPARGELADAIVLDAAGSRALKPGDQLDQGLVQAVEELARLRPDVRLYKYTDRNGLSFRNARGWEVRLGQGPDMETKLRVLHALTEHLASQGIEPTYLDVRFPEAPYYEE